MIGTTTYLIAINHGKASWKNSTIAVRSRRDRGHNQPRSRLFHHGIISMIIKRRPVENQDHDRGPIAARSWPDRGAIVTRSWVFLKRNSSQFNGDLKPQCRSMETASTTHQFHPHDRINRPRSSSQFSSLKACISLLCASSFDRFVKKLSEFRGRY